jgi:DNA mismatch repair protein MutS2
LISALARTPPGARLLLQTLPAHEETSVRRALEETAELTEFRLRQGRLPLAGVDEVQPVLDALASSGGTADGPGLAPILAAARAAEAVRQALATARTPQLSARRDRLPQFPQLLERARQLFESDGSIRDNASPELARLRSGLRRRRAEMSRRLQKLLDARREFLGDAVIVLRNDRYCLPVVASARGRVPGIVHDRSGSGQTVFVEPLETIEANNEIALVGAEERREVERLLTEFGREVLSRADDLELAVGELAELDAIEARVEFGEIARARVPEISEDGGWTLVGARHPLLDPLLAPLRRRALGETRSERPIVPLDLDLPRERRLLVVSGPNAGGKTVLLKTAGLFSLLAQSGIPVPAAAGTRLPLFRSVRAEIGDAQEILSDRSTFSSSMEKLAQVLLEAGPDTLALVDEIGAATDPEEGSALAAAWLAEYLVRGGRAIVTTHLSAIKNFAAAREDAISAAMEFDETTGRPNYRVHPGLSGRSRALSVAREQGMPEAVLSKAQEILGDSWRRQQERESEAEAAIEKLREAERELATERERFRVEAEKTSIERDSLARERLRLANQGLERFEKARRELTRRLEEELAEIRKDSSRHAELSAARLAGEIAESVEHQEGIDQAREELSAPPGTLTVGGRARLRGGKIEGRVSSLEGDSAWLDIAGKRVRVDRENLEPLAGLSSPRSRVSPSPRPEPVAALTKEINVIGQTLDSAITEVEKQLDQAMLVGAGRLRIVHGHGTGKLRDGLREHFRAYAGVARLFPADAREGGNGATIVELD